MVWAIIRYSIRLSTAPVFVDFWVFVTLTRFLTKRPKQRNTKEENRQIKEGKGKDLWNPEDGDSDKVKKKKKAKKSHKDIDARWTKKRGETHYGYKNHVKASLPRS